MHLAAVRRTGIQFWSIDCRLYSALALVSRLRGNDGRAAPFFKLIAAVHLGRHKRLLVAT
jgi:hypothetical protein